MPKRKSRKRKPSAAVAARRTLPCPKCGYGTYTIDCRLVFGGTQTTRRRHCKFCGKRFTSVEVPREVLKTLQRAAGELRRLQMSVADALRHGS